MTERERILKTYEKVKTKFPDVKDKEEIDKLAIKLDKQNLLVKSALLLGGAVLCYIIMVLLSKARTSFTETNALVFMAMLSAVVEMIRTLVKYRKVENTYKPVIRVGEKKIVTVADIMKDCSPEMHNLSEFSVVKELLYDKEDELDVLISNATTHEYHLHFNNSHNDEKYVLTVKKDAYNDAVIGEEYFVVLTEGKDGNNIAIHAYSAAKYTLAEDVMAFCNFDKEAEKVNKEELMNHPEVETDNSIAEPTKKLIPVLSLVFSVISFFIFALPMAVIGFILSVIAVVKQKSKLATTSLVVSIIMLVLAIMVVFMAQNGGL